MKSILKSVLIASLGLAISPAFAAKFEKVTKMKSAAAEKLLVVADHITDQKVFGDAGDVRAVSFTRKDSEQDLKTVKQLNHVYGGLNSDDSGAEELQDKSAAELAEYALAAVAQIDDQKAYEKARADLTVALKAVKSDKNLQIFGTSHADEDGSWQMLDVLDVKSKQVLFVKIGFSGT